MKKILFVALLFSFFLVKANNIQKLVIIEYSYSKSNGIQDLILDRDRLLFHLKFIHFCINNSSYSKSYLDTCSIDDEVFVACKFGVLELMNKYNIKTNTNDLYKCIQVKINQFYKNKKRKSPLFKRL